MRLRLCSVSYNYIKGSGEAFGEALKANTSLKTLNMQLCYLDGNDVKGLARGLAVNGSLTTVWTPARKLSQPPLFLHLLPKVCMLCVAHS